MTTKVIIRPKAVWQKDTCLFCEKEATLEAFLGGFGFGAQIRCCANENCIENAKRLAEAHQQCFEDKKER